MRTRGVHKFQTVIITRCPAAQEVRLVCVFDVVILWCIIPEHSKYSTAPTQTRTNQLELTLSVAAADAVALRQYDLALELVQFGLQFCQFVVALLDDGGHVREGPPVGGHLA